MLLLALTAIADPIGRYVPVAEHTFEDQTGAFSLYVPGKAAAGPVGVAVLLHGDWQAQGREYTWANSWQRLADERGLVLVSAGAPGSACWWTPRKHDRVDYLVDLLQAHVFEAYDVDRSRVHLAGMSGGAFWAAGVPAYRDLPFTGGIVGVCGGDVPRANSDRDFCEDDSQDDPVLAVDGAKARAITAAWKLYYARTADDPWNHAVDSSVSWWRSHGGTVNERITGPGGHCDLDVDHWMQDGIRAVDIP